MKANIIIRKPNPLDKSVVKIEAFKKYANDGVIIITKSDILYFDVKEFIIINRDIKNNPINIIPGSPAAATPSIKKKFALAFWLP